MIGVHIKFGVKVVSVDVRRTSLVLEDGSRIFADLILAADGVHVSFVPRGHIAIPLYPSSIESSPLFGPLSLTVLNIIHVRQLATTPFVSCYPNIRWKIIASRLRSSMTMSAWSHGLVIRRRS